VPKGVLRFHPLGSIKLHLSSALGIPIDELCCDIHDEFGVGGGTFIFVGAFGTVGCYGAVVFPVAYPRIHSSYVNEEIQDFSPPQLGLPRARIV
jgi:hypothetical protein